MQVRPLGLDGVFEISPRKFGDDRGFFSETYNAKSFAEAGIDLTFVQDNHSYSASKGVVRGLHYQLPPFAQDKLVRVTRGAILDVAVDIRKSSPSFGKWVALEVSAEKWNQILVPKGFAHGFMTLVENTEVIYKVTSYYSPEHDRSIRFDDPAIGIDWPISSSSVQLSDKDHKAPLFADAEVFD
ncbi:dTDP-4-dehydrorhamnose 3,5-epimerase [Brucella pseudogrignonensis]|uniref:dTDP-4-dehydrorhamnose 3,5-epimerase n=1 Tax=Brucella pseudogrignonensis TaxID=419475 RepID=UPI0038B4DB51